MTPLTQPGRRLGVSNSPSLGKYYFINNVYICVVSEEYMAMLSEQYSTITYEYHIKQHNE